MKLQLFFTVITFYCYGWVNYDILPGQMEIGLIAVLAFVLMRVRI